MTKRLAFSKKNINKCNRFQVHTNTDLADLLRAEVSSLYQIKLQKAKNENDSFTYVEIANEAIEMLIKLAPTNPDILITYQTCIDIHTRDTIELAGRTTLVPDYLSPTSGFYSAGLLTAFEII